MNTMIPMKAKHSTSDASSPSAAGSDSDRNRRVMDDVFDERLFVEQLRNEKHRAQRSGSPLSILILKQNKSIRAGSSSIRELLKVVSNKTRETDVVGYIDQRTLGVILPYTDEKGAERSAEKIMNCFINPQFTIAVSTYPDEIFESLTKNGCITPDVMQLLLEDSIKHSWLKLKIKRLMDIVGSIVGLILLSPIMLLTAILIKKGSSGPIIFKQDRLGAKGVPFTFYKFRSMYTDSNDQIHREYVLKLINGDNDSINNGDKENPLFKIKADPRITPIGKIIRKTSIDELPQLFNVLKGDMSLVGPRPPLAYEAESYETWHLRRILEMKPGITGLWQVEGRSRTGFDEAVRLDVRYLQTWSLLLDIKILFKTVSEVLKCRGAF